MRLHPMILLFKFAESDEEQSRIHARPVWAAEYSRKDHIIFYLQ